MKLIINKNEFIVTLNNNKTVKDILEMFPLELELERYANHEYYGVLPKKPSIEGVPMTSNAYAENIYYYDGWNAFTVLYGDAQIDPFKVVHIGKVDNESIIELLKYSENTITAKLKTIDS